MHRPWIGSVYNVWKVNEKKVDEDEKDKEMKNDDNDEDDDDDYDYDYDDGLRSLVVGRCAVDWEVLSLRAGRTWP